MKKLEPEERERRRQESMAKARSKYQREKTIIISLKLNKHTDRDLIQKIDSRRHLPGGMQGYIKSCIRKDIRKEE